MPHTLESIQLKENYYFDKAIVTAKNEWVALSNGVKRWAGPDELLTSSLLPRVFSTDDGSQPTGTVHLPGLTVNVGADHKN